MPLTDLQRTTITHLDSLCTTYQLPLYSELFNRSACHCAKCGNTWQPRKDNPAQCPKCKSIKWRG